MTDSSTMGGSIIPKVIHKICIIKGFHTPQFTPPLQAAVLSFVKMNPGYKIKFYNGTDCINYIKKYYTDVELHTFNTLQPYAYKADFLKYLILYNEGGYYSDMRQVCLRSFDSVFPKNTELFAAVDNGRVGHILGMAASFIVSKPKEQWLKNAIDLVNENVKNKFYGECPLCPTAPCLLARAFDMKTKKDTYYIGDYKCDEHGRESIYTHNNTQLILGKYNSKIGGGEGWGNNYNTIYYARKVYGE